MALQWPSGGDSGKEATFKQDRANKWTDAVIPVSGTTIQLSGAGSQLSPVLSGNVLYMLVSKVDCNVCSGTGPLLTSSAGCQLWGAFLPLYHIPKSGSTDRIAAIANSGSNIEAWVSVVEYLDNQ